MPYLIPENIETDRLILRTFDNADWKAIHEHYSDEICIVFTVGRVLTEGESWRAMASPISCAQRTLHWLSAQADGGAAQRFLPYGTA